MKEAMTLYSRTGVVAHPDGATAVTVGVFDGVHRGHLHLLQQLATAPADLQRLVVTLTSHPSFVLGRRSSEYWLDDADEHRQLLFAGGADYVCEMPFSAAVAAMSACDMVRWLHSHLSMRHLLLGYDSRFGSRSHDDFDRLPQEADALGITLQRGMPYAVDGAPISSSRIRATLEAGQVDATAELLGRPYVLRGAVLHGRGVGHTLGFPTANIDLGATRKMLPREGVYAVLAYAADGMPRVGMANLGAAPTFGVEKALLEVHLLDYCGDLYGQTMSVQFVRRLRDIIHFDNPQALEEQLRQDLQQCRQLCPTP